MGKIELTPEQYTRCASIYYDGPDDTKEAIILAMREGIAIGLSPVERSARNFPEDAAHEDGIYLAQCAACFNFFSGHKSRKHCKACDMRDENQKMVDLLFKANSDANALRERVKELKSIAKDALGMFLCTQRPANLDCKPDHWSNRAAAHIGESL